MKKWLICLTVLFSTFLFTNKVNAAEPITTVGTSIYNLEDCTYFTYTEEQIENLIQNAKLKLTELGYNADEFNKFNLIVSRASYGIIPYFYLFNDLDIENNNYDFTLSNSAYAPITIGYSTTNGRIRYYKKNATNAGQLSYNSFFEPVTNVNAGFKYFENNDSSGVYILTNFDLKNSSGEVIIPQNYKVIPPTYNVTLHLNGGKSWDTNEICDDIGCYIVGNKYEDYSINVSGNNLISYLSNVYITKEPMQFVGWYYDEKLTQKVESTDTINSDKDFYAKYQYKNVEDFLKNNTFNSYTFDENYQYAIISLNDQTNRDIYLGLELMSYSFEVYKYNKINSEYHQGASLCLVPIFAKDNKYYYHLDSPLNEDYEILILPKEKLQGKYNFLLSSNAYVTYTNDLKQVVIKDENGNDINTDLENSYDYSQDALLNSENDLLEIFKDLINNKENNVFSYFNQVWNSIKQNRLYVYFITLIIGALIILIIKTASR